MTESREHFALDWIKREIDETLKAARQALEAYAESDRDETKMRACLTYLHQVHGTLLMLELTGVTRAHRRNGAARAGAAGAARSRTSTTRSSC